MKITAYAARRYEGATRRAAGRRATLLTCPPLYDDVLAPESFQDRDLIVFNLHGFPGGNAWLGGDAKNEGIPALRAATLAGFDLGGAGVFAINCYLGDKDSPMRTALQDAGAGWIVSGAGENYGGLDIPVGADVLLIWFRRFMSLLPGRNPVRALGLAKRLTARRAPKRRKAHRRALADALEFGVLQL